MDSPNVKTFGRAMIIHTIHHSVSAKNFVEPLVKSLNSNEVKAELWLENREDLKDFTSAINCPKTFVKFDLSLNPCAVLARLVSLLKKFIKDKPLAIHAHQSRAAFLPLLAAKIAHIPIRIYHNHGTPYLGHRGVLRGLLWVLEFLNCSLATHVITVSKSIHKKMIQHHIVSKSKCRILGEGSACGIDLADFSEEKFDRASMVINRRKFGIPPDSFVVLYVGRPFRRKGFHTLISAWQLMDQSKQENTLLIAGCNSDDIAQATGTIIKNVVALGYVKNLLPLYAACDIVVLPSFHEGLPYSLLEGAAASKALIGSDVPGINSVINNNNGLLVPVESPPKLAEALSFLRNNPEIRRKMGQAGRNYVERCFGRNACLKQMLDYYCQIGIIPDCHSA
ncbi:MAG: glycosyltransferase, partial [Desulfobacteraceae bacterium]|nr:glycosyltransferase [Desulfobacteraceae bacterium]